MIELRPVREPRHGHDRSLVGLAILVVLALGVVLLKPWQGAPAQSAVLASPLPTVSPSPTPLVPGTYRNYSTGIFGDRPHAPAYELWPAGYLVSFGFTRLVSYEHVTEPEAGIDVGGALPIGTASTTNAIGINHPADVTIRSIHLWSFGADGSAAPRRVTIVTLPSPFDLPTFDVIGIPDPRQEDLLDDWTPGLYRLDLLFASLADPAEPAHVVSLSLRVSDDPTPARATIGPSPTPGASGRPTGTFVPSVSGQLPVGSLVAVDAGGDTASQPLGGKTAGQPTCSLAQIWAAEGQTDQPCQAWRVGRIVALGYAARDGEIVTAASLTRLDPVHGTVGRPDLSLRRGLAAVVSADGSPLPDGLYRLTVTLVSGRTLGWYVEVRTEPQSGASEAPGG